MLPCCPRLTPRHFHLIYLDFVEKLCERLFIGIGFGFDTCIALYLFSSCGGAREVDSLFFFVTFVDRTWGISVACHGGFTATLSAPFPPQL